ncbi:MAG: hypothetical protein IPP47_00320 [Bryobacterales bacterium]|nr:hypothetical protein [Bryobacterales bacterium]
MTQKSLQVTGVATVNLTYGWDTEGRPTWQQFPTVGTAGPRFTWEYHANGRLLKMKETDSNGNPVADLVTDATYNAAGQMTQLVTPGGTENRTYNVLGQLTQQNGLGKNVEYRFSPTANDGRITQRKDWVSGEEVSYLYDQLGRLTSAVTTGPEYGLSFSYDGFGNKTQQTLTKGTGPTHSSPVDAQTNRLGGFGYDLNGNVVSGLSGLPGTYAFDNENRLVNNNVETYGYGAANQRLWKRRSNGVYEVYLYGLGSELLEIYEATSGTPWGFARKAGSQRAWFGGRLIRTGSAAVNSDRVGTYQGTYPYGELQGAFGTAGEKFATYHRDTTGLDYAVNRYYSPQMGRFLSADPYQASGGPAKPGSWNRYAYVEGDPVNFNDSQGLAGVPNTYGPPPGMICNTYAGTLCGVFSTNGLFAAEAANIFMSNVPSFSPEVNYANINGKDVRVGADSTIGNPGVGITEGMKDALELHRDAQASTVPQTICIGTTCMGEVPFKVPGWLAGDSTEKIHRNLVIGNANSDFSHNLITQAEFEKLTKYIDPYFGAHPLATPPSLVWQNIFTTPPPLTIAPPAWAIPPAGIPRPLLRSGVSQDGYISSNCRPRENTGDECSDLASNQKPYRRGDYHLMWPLSLGFVASLLTFAQEVTLRTVTKEVAVPFVVFDEKGFLRGALPRKRSRFSRMAGPCQFEVCNSSMASQLLSE